MLSFTKNQNNIQPVMNRFKLQKHTIDSIKSLTPNFGFNGLGEVVFRRTYSRNNESWADVVIRVMEGVMSIHKEHYIKNSLEWDDAEWENFSHNMAISLFHMEWLPPGRGLWMMGTDFTYERGSTALNNCSATDTKDDLVHSAEWTMDCLMNGVGVGFSTHWSGVATMPNKEDFEIYVIPDSREGWVESLIKLMCAYIDSNKYGKNKFPKFDYSAIRPKGEPIKGFGGSASGPDPLEKMHKRVELYLDSFCKGKLETTAKVYDEIKNDDGTSKWVEVEKEISKPYGHARLVADIFNSIGACVVAGNVRRSAEICLGDVEDEEFVNLKNYTKNPERGEIGWMSNNSVVLRADQDYEDFSHIPEIAKRITDNGEPGMINLYNIQKFARYGKEKPDDATLVNPCGEISLENFELCNLAEVFPPRCRGKSTFYLALKYATFYASTVSLLPTHRPETNAVIAKNRRIGVSISGIAQWASSQCLTNDNLWGEMNYTKMTTYLRAGYKIVREYNAELARKAGVPASVRVTTVKPSGSISLLAGVTAGVHYPVSRYAIRRMRIGKDSPLVDSLVKAGIPHEDDTYSDNTLVFSFAIDHGDVRPCDEVSPWEQFSIVAMLQRCYADNCVSATIYFDKEKDAADVEKMLAMYIPVLKSVSMLPHSGHGYVQAPYEPIDKETYEKLKNSYNLPDFEQVKGNVPIGSKFCSGDTCEL
jgi:ribonucleoside-diphosphate reductase alpha chain